MENLEIYLLGNARIERNETSIALGRKRAMGVIAYFLLANEQIITREVLLEQLWPGESDGQAELTSIIHTCKNLGLVKPLAEYDGQAAVEWVCNEYYLDIDELSKKIKSGTDALESHKDYKSALQLASEAAVLLKKKLLENVYYLPDQNYSPKRFSAPEFIIDAQAHLENELLYLIESIAESLQLTDDVKSVEQIIDIWKKFAPFDFEMHQFSLDAYLRFGRFADAQLHYVEALHAYEAQNENCSDLIASYGELNPARIVIGHISDPRPFVGRSNQINQIVNLLERPEAKVTSIVGLPGVGKSTFAQKLVQDIRLGSTYEKVVYGSLDAYTSGSALTETLREWTIRLKITIGKQTRENLAHALKNVLMQSKMLLVCDDIYKEDDALFLKNLVGGTYSSLVITTRFPVVSRSFIDQPNDEYELPLLEEDAALELIKLLAPKVFEVYPEQCRQLTNDLERLPLAITIASRLLHTDFQTGFPVESLFNEIRESHRLLDERSIDERFRNRTTTPTIELLLRRSVDRLTRLDQKRFALLGLMPPKPARFKFDDLKVIWETDDPSESVRSLFDYGLLEIVQTHEYQMHALLVMLSRRLGGWDDEKHTLD